MQDGTFDNVRCDSAELILSKEKKTPGVEVVHRLSDEDGGETITSTLWLSSGALKRSIESLRHMGWQGDDLYDLSTVGSQPYQIVVESEEFKSKWYPKVAWVNANASSGGGGGGLRQERMSEQAKKAFAAKMKGQVIAASGGRAAPPPAREVARTSSAAARAERAEQPPEAMFADAPPLTDDDIPF